MKWTLYNLWVKILHPFNDIAVNHGGTDGTVDCMDFLQKVGCNGRWHYNQCSCWWLGVRLGSVVLGVHLVKTMVKIQLWKCTRDMLAGAGKVDLFCWWSLILLQHTIMHKHTSNVPHGEPTITSTFVVPDGFMWWTGPNGEHHMIPEFLIPARDQAFAGYHKCIEMDICNEQGGVCILFHIQLLYNADASAILWALALASNLAVTSCF